MEHEYKVKNVKLLRQRLDGALQQLRISADIDGSREKSLSMTKCQEAIMWLGMDLKRLGEEHPYPNSHAPDNAIVDKTADGLKL